MVAPITKNEREKQRADSARRQLKSFAMAVCFAGLTATFLLGSRASTISQQITASGEPLAGELAIAAESGQSRSPASQKMHMARLEEFDHKLTARMRKKYAPKYVPSSAEAANKVHDAIAEDYQRLMPSTPKTLSPDEQASRSQLFARRYQQRLQDLPR